ncbi:MAG: sigma-70 family RNA polymerase sigma factor [Bacteroidetes bacterium]|nr:sigma-70 family RNA polymerase sigma factor [Bacteroidota bacterium]MBS1630573.1 sigma-70 family RNA polymerase sigma factor [Bacteroidota bacterium]
MNQPLYPTDEELLQELATGARQATAQVYRKHYPTVMRWLQSAGGSEADAADLFQEAMMVLFEKARNPEFRLSCRIGTYLFAICKHLWYKKLERDRRMPQLDVALEPDASAYEDDLNIHREREEHYAQLDAALESLGEPCRSLLRAFYHQDKSMQEIAAAFGYTNPDNAKTQKYKCLMRLKKIFFNAKALE